MGNIEFRMKIINKIRPDLWICLLLVVATLIAYWPVRDCEFVNFDDNLYITENHHVKEGLTLRGVIWAFSFKHKNDNMLWQPLTWLSHMLIHQLYGSNPGIHHSINLLIHIANSLLLFLVLKLMTGAVWRSAFAAVLFALHPLNVESVAWVSERKNVLSTFSWMLTMLAYFYFVKKPGLLRYVTILIIFTLGLMAKPMIVTLPFVLLMLDFWPLGRFQHYNSSLSHSSNPSTFHTLLFLVSKNYRLVLEKVPVFILSALSILISFLSQQQYGEVISLDKIPIPLRIANALVSYIGYLEKMVWPKNLTVFYPYPDTLPLWQSTGSGLLLICLTFLSISRLKRAPYLAVGWMWYLGTLVPAIGLMQAALWPAMADRFVYVPLIGIYIIIAWSVPELLEKLHYRKIGMAFLSTLIILSLIATTRMQVAYWKNSVVLFERALDVTGPNYVAHSNLGSALIRRGKVRAGIEQIQKAMTFIPKNPKLHYQLGNVYRYIGDLENAVVEYQQALTYQPEYIPALHNLVKIYLDRGRLEAALPLLMRRLQFQPNNANIFYDIACIYSRQNKIDESVRWLKLAVENGYNNLDKLKSDSALNNIRGLSSYKALLKGS